MAEIFGGFDANAVEPAIAFAPLPAGQYDAAIVSADTYVTKSDKFLALKMQLQVLNGQFQNRKLYVNCLIIKKNGSYTGAWSEGDEKTVSIGAGKFSAICRAINVLTPKDTNELLAKPLRVTVKVVDSEENGKQNEVAGYAPRTAAPVASQPVAPQQPATAGAAPTVPAWAGASPF